MSNFMKDMFIEVREKKESLTSPLSEIEQILESVSQIVYDNAHLIAEKRGQPKQEETCQKIQTNKPFDT